jgi:hypothetical protein
VGCSVCSSRGSPYFGAGRTNKREKEEVVLCFVLAGHEKAVRDCVRDPEVIRVSVKDATVHLYYRSIEERYVCVVVGGDDPEDRFVVTAYFTKGVKKGQDLWTK